MTDAPPQADSEVTPTVGSHSEKSGSFRPDIQGLRALAVILVVLDHARIGPFHGGFIGVDVFFVISGFLITGLLLSEADRRGRVSLLDFYARRAKRILPAATLVLAATVVAGYFLLSGIQAIRLFKDTIWATFFAANIKFARDETDYFAQDDAIPPIQHYWSLAVEEQFYLVWPLIVLLLVALFRSRGRARRAVVLAIAAISVASFAWAVYAVGDNPRGAYFSTPARAWELGLGAATAAAVLRLRRLPPGLLAAASWAGVAMIGFAALTFTGATRVPGAPAVLPVLGTALLLGGGTAAAAWGPQRALAVLPMRWVGDRSYSFYLWHWPALIMVGVVWRTPVGWLGLLVSLAALALSDLSYRFVENPFRDRAFFKPRLRGIALYPASVAHPGADGLRGPLGARQRAQREAPGDHGRGVLRPRRRTPVLERPADQAGPGLGAGRPGRRRDPEPAASGSARPGRPRGRRPGRLRVLGDPRADAALPAR